ncbi:DUF4468 domain-containing protein [Mucilaginibacter kameinonensis]|uniref:DUF4468 domain-containing protein n=1 Tax=Mucilaginibacter kameinonensis TaxID=452286 RepID=UPI000EF7C41E|nr:DUF4468 domain-containing protein [Mucilaginibacter kameinonensis]
MKRTLSIILLLLPFTLFGQDLIPFPQLPKDSTTNQVTYKQIIQVPGVSAIDIYNRSREWFATTFKSANSVLQLQDKDAGKLIGKGVFSHSYPLNAGVFENYTIGFTINITVKEGKYRIILDNYTLTSAMGNNPGSPGTIEAIYQNEEKLKTAKSKIQKQVYNIFWQLLTDIDNDSKGLIVSNYKATTTKPKDDF